MTVCVQCQKEMLCDKNSVGVKYGRSHVYPGDRFKCPKCGNLIIITNSAPIFDPELKTQDEYFNMPKEG